MPCPPLTADQKFWCDRRGGCVCVEHEQRPGRCYWAQQRSPGLGTRPCPDTGGGAAGGKCAYQSPGSGYPNNPCKYGVSSMLDCASDSDCPPRPGMTATCCSGYRDIWGPPPPARGGGAGPARPPRRGFVPPRRGFTGGQPSATGRQYPLCRQETICVGGQQVAISRDCRRTYLGTPCAGRGRAGVAVPPSFGGGFGGGFPPR